MIKVQSQIERPPLAGDPVLPGFILDLTPIWEPVF